MEQMTLQIPRMWADHHVSAVRQVLSGLGLQEIEASAAHGRVFLSFDPAMVGREQILQALEQAGYLSAEQVGFPVPPANKDRDSAWFTRDARVTQTNRLDLEMSGDFRKY